MFFSLLQTLVCVLLVNTGLYALHLTGSTTSSGGNGGPSGTGVGGGSINGNLASASQFTNPSAANPFKTTSTSNRLNEVLADLAQQERERLMVMGLAKQTAEDSIGYHGRPIITGRIKMHPAEDIDSEYSAWLSQQARNIMFGNVVKQPLNVEEDYDTGGGGNDFDVLRPSTKYEYGRVVQPVDRESEREFENPYNLDSDDFMELEPVNDMMEEDMFPDMNGYDYLEQHQHHPQQMSQFPGLRQTHQTHHMPALYQNHEPVDETKQAVEEFLKNEQKIQNLNRHQQAQQQQQQQQQQQLQQQKQQQQQQQQFNAKYRNNIRMEQKWLRKRNQQEEQLTRNIFGQKNAKIAAAMHQKPAASLHHFKGLSNNNKLALANSEATATTRNKDKQQEFAQQVHEKEMNKNSSSSTSASHSLSSSSSAATSTAALNHQNNEFKAELLQHPNHKRSGLTPASLASSAGVSSPHSLASQLMLRTARGQRQYDVPQIECPTAMDGMERFACPTPDVQGRYRCIDDHVLCDGFIDCPEGEDEDRRSCMFYKTTKAHLDVLADALLRWARGR